MFESTLSSNAQGTLALLGSAKILPLMSYLAGGTALALQLGHRISIDFDFFTPSEFDQEKLSASLSEIGKFAKKNIAKNTLMGKFNGVDFSIFTYKPSLLFPTTNYQEISLADPREIGAMKISAVLTRGVKKDFVDLYFLAKNAVSIDDCLDYFDQKYHQLDNQIYGIIRALSYFVEVDTSAMPQMLKKADWKDIKVFFEREAVRLGKKYL